MKAVEALIVGLGMVIFVSITIGHSVKRIHAWHTRRRLAKRPWTADASTLDDGSMVVRVMRAGQRGRIVAVLPGGMETMDYQSDLRIALEEAEAEAEVLNSRSHG